jgi:dihydropteroate synthase
VGLSRKSMLGAVTGRRGRAAPGQLAAAVIAARNGARILRVHDVAATVDALRLVAAVAAASRPTCAAHPGRSLSRGNR